MELPLQYILDKLYRHADKIKFKKYSNSYNFACPVCNEGSSKGHKTRGYFFTNDNHFYCHNCQQSWTPIKWICHLENKEWYEVVDEAATYNKSADEVINERTIAVEDLLSEKTTKKLPSLPYDSINLSDTQQLFFYKDNKIVQDCLRYIQERRLFTAVNRSKTYYISLTDFCHRNRLCIPFYDISGKIVFYQSRAIYKKDEEFGKYISKIGGTKSVYGIEKIDTKFEHIFIFEGPIDSMFVKNGVAVGGLNLTTTQEEQLNAFRMYKKIWVLDNQLDNPDVLKKYKQLVEGGQSVFFWPEELKSVKDLNELCVEQGRDSVSPNLFIKNSDSGFKASLRLSS